MAAISGEGSNGVVFMSRWGIGFVLAEGAVLLTGSELCHQDQAAVASELSGAGSVCLLRPTLAFVLCSFPVTIAAESCLENPACFLRGRE